MLEPAKPKGKLTEAGTLKDCPESKEIPAGTPIPFPTGTFAVRIALTICAGQPCGKMEFNSGTIGVNVGGSIALRSCGGITAAAGPVANTLLTIGAVNSGFTNDGSCKEKLNFCFMM